MTEETAEETAASNFTTTVYSELKLRQTVHCTGQKVLRNYRYQ